MTFITKVNIFDLQNLQILLVNWAGTSHPCKDKKIFLNTVCQALFYISQLGTDKTINDLSKCLKEAI